MSTFRERLTATIDFLDIPQDEVAGIVGYSQATVSRWLSGRYEPHESAQDTVLQRLSRKPLEEKIPENFTVKLGGTRKDDFRRWPQMVRLKRMWKSHQSLVRLTVETMFRHESEKIFAWFETRRKQ